MASSYDSTVAETIDLTDPDRKLTDSETSDAIHRAGYPRSAIADTHGDSVCGLATRYAADLADARCGIEPDLPPGPHPARGTLRWYRHYIVTLDGIADDIAPGWRTVKHQVVPFAWCDYAFGQCTPPGYVSTWRAPLDKRDRDIPRPVGGWTFDLPNKEG